MHALTRWFIHNPVAANLLMLLILAAGYLTATSMRIEGFPKVPADTVVIETTFPGAYTEQVDEGVTRLIERALEGLAGVDRIRASSMSEYSLVEVKGASGHDLERLVGDIRDRLTAIARFPKAAERPVISRNEFELPALIVQLSSEGDPHTLQAVGRQLRRELLARPEIAKLNRWGLRSAEIAITADPALLEHHGLTFEGITERIRDHSLRSGAGEVKSEGGRVELRADAQAFYAREFAEIPLLEHADGTRLLLGEVARVEDGFEELEMAVRFNGRPAIGMEVMIGRDQNLLEIARVVEGVVERLRPTLPDGVALEVWADASHYIDQRLGLLRANALQGLLLVFLLLALFLDARLAFWVALGVPVAIAGALAVMGLSALDHSLNDVTTFGFIIALGILVDDAVVVGESVHEARRGGGDSRRGTERGVARVAVATIYGVLTTIAAFYPMTLIDNPLGKVLAGFAVVVILTLAFSLLESKFILPAHLAHTDLSEGRPRSWPGRAWGWLRASCQGGLEWLNRRLYRPLLEWTLTQRYAVLALFVAGVVLGAGLIARGVIATTFFPDIPTQVITVTLKMDARAPYALTLAHAERIEAAAVALNGEYRERFDLNEGPLRHRLVAVTDATSLELYAELTPPAEREALATRAIVDDWRRRVGALEGAEQLTFTASEEGAGGFAVELFADDEARLAAASERLKEALRGIEGVSGVHDDLKGSGQEVRLKLKPEARHLGFTEAGLAAQLHARFGGVEAQRIQRDGQEIRVMVRAEHGARDTLHDLLTTRIVGDDGHWVPLTLVAEATTGYGPGYLTRRDGWRVNQVRARVDKGVIAPEAVMERLRGEAIPAIETSYPDVSVRGAGELEEMGEIKGGLVKALIFTALLIYVLRAIPLKSYWQPLVIMSVIPFAFMGAAYGHLIMGLPVSLLSFFGMLALAGVVVNDSLVMMTRYNQAREGGMDVRGALIDCGTGRMRAIFLTTVTTVAGLTPLMGEQSEQAQYLIPAAVSLAFGELFATAIMLLLVPVLIHVAMDLGKGSGGGAQTP